MSAKTIFIIVITILVTIILMKNTDEVNFWIFGNQSVPKLAVLGVMFVVGFILGYLAGRPRKKEETFSEEDLATSPSQNQLGESENKWLDPEDDEYIN